MTGLHTTARDGPRGFGTAGLQKIAARRAPQRAICIMDFFFLKDKAIRQLNVVLLFSGIIKVFIDNFQISLKMFT